MLEFENGVDKYTKKIKASRNGFLRGWNRFDEAERTYNEIKKLREQILLERLAEKGLAVCSGNHPINSDGVSYNLSLEQLGVFPIEIMRLHFIKRGPFEKEDKQGDYSVTTMRLELLCPEHFPKKEKWTDEEHWIDSEVKVIDGKYVLLVNGMDITKLVTQNNLDMDPDGLRPFLVDREIYRRLGIPDLPDEVDFDSVNRGY